MAKVNEIVSNSIATRRAGNARFAALCATILGVGGFAARAQADFLVSPTGSSLSYSNVDDGTTAITTGLTNFKLFGTTATSLYACTNGFISNNSTYTAYSNTPLASATPTVIAPLWDDLYQIASTNDKVTVTNNPGIYSAITWQVHKYNTTTEPQNFQVTLFGAADTIGLFSFQPNDIAFSYGGISTDSNGFNGTATIGLTQGTTAASPPLTAPIPGTTDGQITAGTNSSLIPQGTGQFILFRPDIADNGYTVSIQSTQVAAGSIYYYTGTGTPPATFDTTSQNFSLNGSPAAFSNGSGGATVVFDDSATVGSHSVTVGSAVNPNVLQFNNSSSSYTLNGSYGIVGPGTVAITGGGTVTFNTSNSYTGNTLVTAGTLVLGPTGSIANSPVTVSAAGSLLLSGSSHSLSGLAGAGPVSFTGGTGSSLILTGTGSYTGALTLGTGSLTINLPAASAITLGASNSYSGGTTLNSGALLIGTGSLGTGTVSLQGGSLGAVAAGAVVPNQLIGNALVLPANSGALELSSTSNSFAGPVVIQSGATLVADSAGAIGGLNPASPSTGTIIVASGGSFDANTSSSTMGQGLTIQISGPGATLSNTTTGFSGASGALRGGDNLPTVWAGNVNVSGPAYIVPGASTGAVATLTLTGSISGSGPVSFSGSPLDTYSGATTIVAPSVGHTNTYTGETQLIGEPNNTAGTTTLQLGGNNALSTVAGLNIIAGKPANVSFDLAGYSQSVAYLSGSAQNGYAIINSGSNPSVLTINSGSATTASTSSTAIQGNVSIVKLGAGNQTLGGNSSYSGNTTVTAGTLSVGSANALGSGTVLLNGGTLAFPASTLSGFSTYTLNGAATLNGNAINVTNGAQGTAGSASTSTRATLNLTQGFTATYTMNLNSANSQYIADGAGLVFENDPNGPHALGASGGALGWQGIQNSFFAGFDTYKYNYGSNDVRFGTSVTNTFDQQTTSGVSLVTQLVQVSLSYDGSTISETITGASSGTYHTTYAVNLASVLGSNMAYIGFTGGSGDGVETAVFSNFSMTGAATLASVINNPIVASAGTTSTISVQVSPGNNTESITSLTLNNGSSVKLTTISGSTGLLALTTPSLSIASSNGSFTGQLDIGANDVILPGQTLALVNSMVKQGYSNGTWAGKGITSSTAAGVSNHLTAVGVIVNDNPLQTGTPLYGTNGGLSSTFDGAPTNDGDVLVKYTYYGDTNLDGAVDGSDYASIDSAYLAEHFVNGVATAPVSGWYNGDFNYDGVVDGSDYTLMDNTYNQQGSSLGSNPAALLATATAQVAGSSVPEPASLSLLAIGATALLGRRRSKR